MLGVGNDSEIMRSTLKRNMTTAIATVLSNPSSCTMDIGGTFYTTELIACIKAKE